MTGWFEWFKKTPEKEIEAEKKFIEKYKHSTRYSDKIKNAVEKAKKTIEDLESLKRLAYEYLKLNKNFISVDSQDKLLNILLKKSSNPLNIISIGTKEDKTWLDIDKLIAPSHAYSINRIDREKETIFIVNPWNSASEVEISFDEFRKYFCSVNIAEID